MCLSAAIRVIDFAALRLEKTGFSYLSSNLHSSKCQGEIRGGFVERVVGAIIIIHGSCRVVIFKIGESGSVYVLLKFKSSDSSRVVKTRLARIVFVPRRASLLGSKWYICRSRVDLSHLFPTAIFRYK